MGTDTKYVYKARLFLEQPVLGKAKRVISYKRSTCVVEFTSKFSEPEIVRVEIINARLAEQPPIKDAISELLASDISALDLSTRVKTVLLAAGINTIEDLASLQPYELLKHKGAGETVLKECAGALESIGLYQGMRDH